MSSLANDAEPGSPFAPYMDIPSQRTMKYFLYASVLIPSVFGFFVNDGFNSPISLLITTYTSVFWGTAAIYLFDFFMAMAGRNSLYMQEFYASVKTDLLVSTVVGVTFIFLFWHAPNSYSLSNVDIAGAGLPFFVYGLADTIHSGRMKIANNKIPSIVVHVFAAVQIISYGTSVYSLSNILGGNVHDLQSIWIQLTIIFSALTFFFVAKQIRFILTKQKMEVSPVLLKMFQSVPISPMLYKDVWIGADIWNKEVKNAKAVERKRANTRRKK